MINGIKRDERGEKMSIAEIFLGNDRYKYILEGLRFSLLVTAFAAVIGILIGIIVALFRISEIKPFKFLKGTKFEKWADFNPISFIAMLYIDIIRGTPAVVQLMIMHTVIFGKVSAPKLLVAGLAFGINSGAYVAEIIRAGIMGLDKGQMEAARSLGMGYGMSMYYIIIPQAIKNILPTLVSEFIILLKETSIVGFIGGMDLLRSANVITSQTYRGFEPLMAVALIYLALTGIFTKLMRIVERRMRRSD
ncbi:ABC transporter permease subunit [Defluviitalea raffinosedens]|jgi:polar amino acid transport system permease protein|uniref:ABC transporter permease subunit n=2 Tax=Defluviitalea raffinosedens TaxID=1450156 RepID=A0A7C8HDP7_9FIRM|nr:ABC transporter permease subunit [Defluviitalea raffinosedens]HHW66394.1 amino acid ABC transporter permease [Candidatus Epulonipiscium sp.]